MDLKDLTPNLDDLVVEIKHPSTGDNLLNDDGTNMTIIVLAPHSKEYQKVQHEQINKRLRKAQKNKTQDIDYSDIEESTIDLLSKVTKSWSVTFDKEMPKEHEENETELDKFCHENPDADECRIYDT